MSSRVDLFNKQVVFVLRIPNIFTKQIEFRLDHIVEYSWFDTTRTQSVNMNCHP